MFRKILAWYSRHRTGTLVGIAVICATLGVRLGLYRGSPALYPLAAGMIGCAGIAMGQLLFTLHRALHKPSARLAALRVEQLFPRVRVLMLGYVFTAGGVFVVVAAIFSALSSILT